MSAAVARRLVRRGRRAAESLMVDECTITRVTGATDNPDGTVAKTTATVYSGKCRLQTYDPYERQAPVGEVEVTIRRDVLLLPVSGTEDVTTGHEVTFTSASLDSALVGRIFRVAGPSRKTHQTQRKLYVEEVTQG